MARKEFVVEDDFDPPPGMYAGVPIFPTCIMAAGFLWMIFGFLIGIALASSVAINAAFVSGTFNTTLNPDNLFFLFVPFCFTCLSLVFGSGIAYVGNQTIRGQASDTLANAIGSMTIGVLSLAGAATSLLSEESVEKAVAGGAYILCGIGLTIAGLLAALGRKNYLAWRSWQKGRAFNI